MTQPIIQIEDLYKSYPGKNGPAVALEHINLDIYPGEIFGIIGLSGIVVKTTKEYFSKVGK